MRGLRCEEKAPLVGDKPGIPQLACSLQPIEGGLKFFPKAVLDYARFSGVIGGAHPRHAMLADILAAQLPCDLGRTGQISWIEDAVEEKVLGEHVDQRSVGMAAQPLSE